MEPVHVIVVTDVSGHQALYVGGELKESDETIYACDIAAATEGMTIQFSHLTVEMPESEVSFPDTFEKCMLWNPVAE